jgi:hypothetical protein
MDGVHPFSEPCVVILVNPYGCAARFGRALEIGAVVQLEGLPVRERVSARVVTGIHLEYEKFWILGLALDEPGNVWGIKTPPEDWSRNLEHGSFAKPEQFKRRLSISLRRLLNCFR